MSKRRRKPGRLWWLGTFAIGVYSPRKGQRRVNNAMREKDDRIAELEEENGRLHADKELLAEEKHKVAEENHTVWARLEIADGIAEMNKVKMAADKAAVTMPLRVVTRWGTTEPGVTNGHPRECVTKNSDQASQVS